jgi:3-deoxy-D-manno-octulosonate 8-phosphate phosphatase (KDO 8-P phosphatase)
MPTKEHASRIQLLVLDVDGVMTDGRLYFDADGREAKVFHVRDGYGIKQVMRLGIEVAVISGRKSKAVEVRMAELGIKHVRLGQENKLDALLAITELLDVPMKNVACLGDDLPDLPLLETAGLGIAVADGHQNLRASADWCTQLDGGQGCVREVCDFLIEARR